MVDSCILYPILAILFTSQHYMQPRVERADSGVFIGKIS